MNKLSIFTVLVVMAGIGAWNVASAQAQVVFYGPTPPSTVVVPAPAVPGPVVAGPVVGGPMVTAYPPAVVVPSQPAVTTYRPVLVPPAPYVAPVVTSRYRPTVVAPGIGGWPNAYVPGQPVRNALRFAIP